MLLSQGVTWGTTTTTPSMQTRLRIFRWTMMGVTGVPISFLDMHCLEQFTLLGDSRFHYGQAFANDICSNFDSEVVIYECYI